MSDKIKEKTYWVFEYTYDAYLADHKRLDFKYRAPEEYEDGTFEKGYFAPDGQLTQEQWDEVFPEFNSFRDSSESEEGAIEVSEKEYLVIKKRQEIGEDSD